METNFLKLYLDANKTLARTMVIKSLVSAGLINDEVIYAHGEASLNEHDPSTWKYYLNLAGEYHFSDEVMTVTSTDTLETIVFSKENLAIHTATAEAYQYDTRYYNVLLNRYPAQEQLILGILYPTNVNKAINAEDYSILNYPAYLVEPQEITLIDELDTYIKHFNIRWSVSGFWLADELYNTAQHAVMYLAILPKLLNLRLKRCKTNEVHSFHIREYLASHGKLDIYLPYMTLKQALFLYRNLRFIDRNSGKTNQFKKLIEKLLTDRRIPIGEISVRHLNKFDDNFYPIINVRRKPINTQYNTPEKDYFDLETLHLKEDPLAYGNPVYVDDYRNEIKAMFANSDTSVTQSKDLESSMIDYTDAVPDTLEVTLLRQWASHASKGLYVAVVSFKDPVTLEERTLTAYNAFIYMYYLTLMSVGLIVDSLPEYINIKSRKLELPTVTDMLKLVDNKHLLRETATVLIAKQPKLVKTRSVKSFFNLVSLIFDQLQDQWRQVSHTEDLYRRAYIANLIHSLYEDESIILPLETQDMRLWLKSNNLPAYNFSQAQVIRLIADIFSKGTGLTIDDTKKPGGIQRAMIAILSQLSSYSIQFITEINKSKIVPLNWAAIRGGNIHAKAKSYEYIGVNVRTMDARGKESIIRHMDISNESRVLEMESVVSNKYSINSSVSTYSNTVIESCMYVPSNGYNMTLSYDVYDSIISDDSVFVGYETYIALTDSQKNQLQSIY
jgi:hypothetical protein